MVKSRNRGEKEERKLERKERTVRREVRNIRGRNKLNRIDGRPANERVPTRVIATRATPTTNRAPNMRADMNHCIVAHREMFHTVYGLDLGSAGINVRQPINPGNQFMFPWLAKVAQNYESYVFKKLKFEFITSSPSTVPGTITMAVDFDPRDPAPDDASAISALNAFVGAVTAPVYTPRLDVVCRPANLHKRKTYFVTPSEDVGQSQGVTMISSTSSVYDRSSDCGQLMVATVAPAASPLGQIFVCYEVELLTPQYNPQRGAALAIDIPYPDNGPLLTSQINSSVVDTGTGTMDQIADTTTAPAFPYGNYDKIGVSSVVSGRWKNKNAFDNTTVVEDGIKIGYGTGSSTAFVGSQERFVEVEKPGYYVMEGMAFTAPATTTVNDDALSVPFPVNANDSDERSYMVEGSNVYSYSGDSTRGGLTGSDTYSRMVLAIENPYTKLFIRCIDRWFQKPLSVDHTLHAMQTTLSWLGPLNTPTAAAALAVVTGWSATPLLIQAMRRKPLPAFNTPRYKQIAELKAKHIAPIVAKQHEPEPESTFLDERGNLIRNPSCVPDWNEADEALRPISPPVSLHDIEDLPPKLVHLAQFNPNGRGVRTKRGESGM